VDVAASTQFIFILNRCRQESRRPCLVTGHSADQLPPWACSLRRLARPCMPAAGKDDLVYAYTVANGTWSLAGTVALAIGKGPGMGSCGEMPAASGISAGWQDPVVSQRLQRSISVIDTGNTHRALRADLRPFSEQRKARWWCLRKLPFWRGLSRKVLSMFSSDRDRES